MSNEGIINVSLILKSDMGMGRRRR